MRVSSSMKLTRKLIPLTLTALIICIDQISKHIVSKSLPYGKPIPVVGDFFRLLYVKNPTIAFSIGRDLDGHVRDFVVFLLPVVVLIIIILFYFISRDITSSQYWALAAIIGGGLSNILDRFVKSGGVVDFLDFKFYGILGFKRWPTFNFADMSVVVAGIFLVLSFVVSEVKRKNE